MERLSRRINMVSTCAVVAAITVAVVGQDTTTIVPETTTMPDWSICVATKTLEEIRLDTRATTCVDLAPYCDDSVHGHYIRNICPTVCEICLNPPENAGWTVAPEEVVTPDEFKLNTATAAALFALGMVVFVVLGYCTYTLVANRCSPKAQVEAPKILQGKFDADWDDEYFEFGVDGEGEDGDSPTSKKPDVQSPGYELNPISPDKALSPDKSYVAYINKQGLVKSLDDDGMQSEDGGDSQSSRVEQLRAELLNQMRGHEESNAVWSVDSPIPEGVTPEDHYLAIMGAKGLESRNSSTHGSAQGSFKNLLGAKRTTDRKSTTETDLDAVETAEPQLETRDPAAHSSTTKSPMKSPDPHRSSSRSSNKNVKFERQPSRSPPGKWKEELAKQQQLLSISVAKGQQDLQSANSQITHLATQMEILTAQRATLAEGVQELTEKLNVANHHNNSLAQQNSRVKNVQKIATETLLSELKLLKDEHETLKNMVAHDMFPDMVRALKSTTDHLVKKSDSVIEDATRDLMVRYKYEARQRKLLYNHIQELKGNVRVFCRVRSDPRSACVMTFPDAKGVGTPTELTCPQPNDETVIKRFEFDRVFNPEDDQDAVFDDTEPLITSCVDGYNVAIIAYGQTGSGKTYTMMGTPSNPGVNRRAIRELLRVCSQRDAIDHTITVSLLEIYNDTIVDLVSSVPAVDQNLTIRMDPKTKQSFVPGLTWREVASEEDIVKVINEGESNRTVAFTKMNSASSRSHLMLSITIVGEDAVSGHITKGKLTMVDLAGSERIAKSEVSGKELAEAVAINKSLSCLGQVFVGLQTNQSHIPYRNSKLTHILQESLGGDAKACVFINVSPARSNLQETLSTLQFGSDIRKIEIRSGGGGKGSNPGTPNARRKSSMVPKTDSPGRRASTAPHMDTPGRRMSLAPVPGSPRKNSIA
eukprot:m.217891 g.217891  ORF g.217891 m.217891 type:complete len:930 (+) comp33246_c0_seq2:454-3243(+)